MEISSVNSLKSFVNERLTAAAEEIFGIFEKTLSVYQEEIARQRRLLDTVLKPDIKLQKTDVPQPQIRGNSVLPDQEGITQLDQELRIKQEEEEICSSYGEEEEERFAQHQDTVVFKLSPAGGEGNHNEIRSLLLDPDQSAGEQASQSSYSDEWTQSESKGMNSSVNNRDTDRHSSSGENQHICCICGRNFDIKEKLKVHMRTHTGETVYRCSYCNKEFRFNSSLSRHLRVHTGEKPYECTLCGKRFNAGTTLKVHYRIHTGEKPFKCKICEKAFTTCSNLKKHMALHR